MSGAHGTSHLGEEAGISDAGGRAGDPGIEVTPTRHAAHRQGELGEGLRDLGREEPAWDFSAHGGKSFVPHGE